MRRLARHAEAALALTLASLLIACLPFRRIAQAMASGTATRPIDPPAARRIARAIRRCARVAPWRTLCFEQGLAAHLMLRRRRRAAALHYGAGHDAAGKLIAHVWVTSGGVDVIGGEDVARYGLLATFPPSA